MQNRGRSTFILFVLGVFANTKVYLYGTIAISELVAFALAPFLFIIDYGKLKRDGFMPCIWMLFLLSLAMLASSLYNHTPLPFVIKQSAVLYSVFSYVILFHRLLRNNYKGLGIYFIGVAISSIITIFAFNPQATIDVNGSGYVGATEVEEIIGGPLFWVSRLQRFGNIPLYALYLQTPSWYAVIASLAYAVFVMTTTISGRSVILSLFLAIVMMLIGGKSRLRMARMGKHIITIAICGILVVLVYKMVYQYTASKGMLGEDARVKYEAQTRKGRDIATLIMSGRIEPFIGMTAVLDKPIIGHGPHALDTNGYAEKFLIKYGDAEDVSFFLAMRRIYGTYYAEIPAHSHIVGAWLHYGIVGLIFYLYIIWIVFQHIRKYISAIPQWFGYYALTLCLFAWEVFFSAFTPNRNLFALMLVSLFFARAIGQGRLQLPYDMEMEARKYDK